MNNKFFVPFETAKALKEKGYPEYADIFYDANFYDANGCFVNNFSRSNYDAPIVLPVISSPTYHEVLDWLETEKDILVSVDTDEVNSYLCRAYSRYRSGTLCHSQWTSSREEALNEVIIKTLEML